MTGSGGPASGGPGSGGPAVRIDVLTIFPDLVAPWLDASLLGRARRSGLVDLRVVDLRSGAGDARRSVDDSPFGGGAGMVLAPEPVWTAVEAAAPRRPLLLLSAGGRRFDQRWAEHLAAGGGLSLLCGRYEGVDQRICDHLVDGEVSIGDYVLAGGEVAALAVVEAVCRLVPGVMGNEESAREESFTGGLLEYPQYTRPASWRGWEVPEVLLSGDHERVRRWRLAQSLARTARLRPDLLRARGIDDSDRAVLAEWGLSVGGAEGGGAGGGGGEGGSAGGRGADSRGADPLS